MGQADLKGQRSHFGFSNKYDKNDALCLAASYFDPYFINKDGSKRFLRGYRIKEIQAVRELVLELEQLDKLRTTLVNQLRQRFALEYPEAAAQTWHTNDHGMTPIVDGFPVVEWIETKNNGRQKRNRSLQHFQSYLGLSRQVEQSGDKENIRWFNSKMMRSHYYIWCLSSICPKPPKRLNTEIGKKLGKKWDNFKDAKQAKGKDTIMRLTFYATRLLFQQLKDNICF